MSASFSINFDSIFNPEADKAKAMSSHNETQFSIKVPQALLNSDRSQLEDHSNTHHEVSVEDDGINFNRIFGDEFDRRESRIEDHEYDVSSIASVGGIHLLDQPSIAQRYRLPGQRLFYESQQQQSRKNKERERALLEAMLEEAKNATFKPIIDAHSKKLAEKTKPFISKLRDDLKPTHVQKQMNELLECTFKPALMSKQPQQRSKDVFSELYKDHIHREAKKKITEQLSTPQQRAKMTQDQLNQFLKRNKEFQTKVSRKQQLLSETANSYDLDTGIPLYQPCLKASKGKFRSSQRLNSFGSELSLEIDSLGTTPTKSSVFSKTYDETEREPISLRERVAPVIIEVEEDDHMPLTYQE